LLGSILRTRASLCMATHRNRPSLASDSESPPSWIVTATVLVCDRFGAGLRPEGRSRYPCRRWPCHRPGSRRGSSPPSGPRLARCGGPCRLEGGQPDRSCGVSTASPRVRLRRRGSRRGSSQYRYERWCRRRRSPATPSRPLPPSCSVAAEPGAARSPFQRLRCPGATTHLLVGSRPSAARLRSAREHRVAPTEAHGPLLAPAPRRPSDQAGS
jgi:hypothetical protein